MTGLLALVLLVLAGLALAAAFLTALYYVVSAAVEEGVRRSLPDSALRPSLRAQLQQPLRREDEW